MKAIMTTRPGCLISLLFTSLHFFARRLILLSFTSNGLICKLLHLLGVLAIGMNKNVFALILIISFVSNSFLVIFSKLAIIVCFIIHCCEVVHLLGLLTLAKPIILDPIDSFDVFYDKIHVIVGFFGIVLL